MIHQNQISKKYQGINSQMMGNILMKVEVINFHGENQNIIFIGEIVLGMLRNTKM
jgi:hypothetical protein